MFGRPLFIGSMQLEFVRKVENLGFILTSKLTCTDQVNNKVGKIYATLRYLRFTLPIYSL